jgi:hypothetical protein
MHRRVIYPVEAPHPVLRISYSGSLTHQSPSPGPSHFPLSVNPLARSFAFSTPIVYAIDSPPARSFAFPTPVLYLVEPPPGSFTFLGIEISCSPPYLPSHYFSQKPLLTFPNHNLPTYRPTYLSNFLPPRLSYLLSHFLLSHYPPYLPSQYFITTVLNPDRQ